MIRVSSDARSINSEISGEKISSHSSPKQSQDAKLTAKISLEAEVTSQISENIFQTDSNTSTKSEKMIRSSRRYSKGRSNTSLQREKVQREKITCEDLIIGGFNNIDSEIVRNMAPKEQVKLISSLQNTIQKIDEVRENPLNDLNNPKLASIMAIQNQEHKLNAAHKKHSQSLERAQQINLIHLVETNSNHIWEVLSLTGEKIIPVDVLFTCILEHIHILKQDIMNSIEKIKNLLNFCSLWLQENQGNQVVKDAQIPLEAIIEATSCFPDQSKDLKKKLEIAFLAGVKNKETTPLIPEMQPKSKSKKNDMQMLLDMSETKSKSKKLDIQKFLDTIEKQSKSDSIKMAKAFAKDCCTKQAKLYLQIQPQDFIQKTKMEKNPPSTALQLFNKHFERLNSNVFEKINGEKNPIKKDLFIKFFFVVALESIALSDYPSAFAISSVISQNYKDNKTIDKFQNYFYDKSLKKLRKSMDACHNFNFTYIPFISPYSDDLEKYIGGKEQAVWQDSPTFDIDFITEIYRLVQIPLRAQENWKDKNFIYETNFFTQIFPSYLSLDAYQREALAVAAAEREALAEATSKLESKQKKQKKPI